MRPAGSGMGVLVFTRSRVRRLDATIRIHFNNCGDPLMFHLPISEHLHFNNNLVYNQIPVTLTHTVMIPMSLVTLSLSKQFFSFLLLGLCCPASFV